MGAVEVTRHIDEDKCVQQAGIHMVLKVHYTAWLAETGETFSSTMYHGKPFVFVLGKTPVNMGWDAGFFNMCLGERRRVTVSSGKGYGEKGVPGKIPPNATLVYDIELLGIDDLQVEEEEVAGKRKGTKSEKKKEEEDEKPAMCGMKDEKKCSGKADKKEEKKQKTSKCSRKKGEAPCSGKADKKEEK